MNRWDDRNQRRQIADIKRGFVNKSTNEIARNYFMDGLSVGKKTTRDNDGNDIIVKKHGMYEKVIYNDASQKKMLRTGVKYDDVVQHPYFVFHNTDNVFTVDNCYYLDGTLEKNESLNYTEILTANTLHTISFSCKRFSHNVPQTGLDGTTTIVARDLYYIASSLWIPSDLYAGWKNFAIANPTFPLVVNNSNNNMKMTISVYNTLERINKLVNHSHRYTGDAGGDNWHIMEDGEEGDCEDFALTKAKILLDLGYPASALHIETAMIKGSETPGTGHAWLVVQTDQGDYALDTSSDSIQANCALMSNIGTAYIMRRRQIGNNWAVIDPASWLLSAYNSFDNGDDDYTKYYMYIFDPLLNIFYPFAYKKSLSSFHDNPPNVNFELDGIYMFYSGTTTGTLDFTKINLAENTLEFTKIDTVSDDYEYAVTKEGSYEIIDNENYCETISYPGYYGYVYHDELVPSDPERCIFQPQPTIAIGGSSPFIYFETYPPHGRHFLSPWGETKLLNFVDVGLYSNVPASWFHIESEYNFQAYYETEYYLFAPEPRPLRSDVDNVRIYRNDIFYNDVIASACAISEANLLGFAYIPLANRLCGATIYKYLEL